MCPPFTKRSRDGALHTFNMTYVNGFLSVTHNAYGTCVGECDWSFVLMLECCVVPLEGPTVGLLDAPVVDGVAVANAINVVDVITINAITTNALSSNATRPEAAIAVDVDSDDDDDNGPPVGLIVGIVVAVGVVVAGLSLYTCQRDARSVSRGAQSMYSPLKGASTGTPYTRQGDAPLLLMKPFVPF